MGCKLSRSASQEDVTRVKQSGGRGNKNRKGLFGSKQERRADAPSSEEEDTVGDAPVGPPIGRHVGPANSVLSRRDTPAGGLLLDSLSNGMHDGRPGDSTTTSALHTNFQDRLISSGVAACTKPIGQSMESESQADFFRMLDAKIAHNGAPDYDDPADVLRMARMAVKEANQKAVRMQNHTTQQLVERIKDLKYWSAELDREMQDLNEENHELSRYLRRVQQCLEVTNGAAKTNQTSLAVRRKRIPQGGIADQTDRVGLELRKETDVITDSIRQIREFVGTAEKHSDAHEIAKQRLLRDWTLKQEAINLDNRSAAIGGDSRTPMERKGTPHGANLDDSDDGPLQRMSEHSEWVENTAANLNYSAKARAQSRKLVQKIVLALRELAQLMRAQALQVEATLRDSSKTVTEMRDSVNAQVNAKEKEIRMADSAITEIQYALRQKGGPLQVALSRQNQRQMRPGIELCLDKAQHALNAELMTLKSSLLALEHQLDNARESRKRLDQERRKLMAKQEVYSHNIKIDHEILRMVRTTYPQEIQLSGFLLTEKKLQD